MIFLKKFKIVEVRCVEFKSALRKSPHRGEPSGVITVDLLMFSGNMRPGLSFTKQSWIDLRIWILAPPLLGGANLNCLYFTRFEIFSISNHKLIIHRSLLRAFICQINPRGDKKNVKKLLMGGAYFLGSGNMIMVRCCGKQTWYGYHF